MNVLMSHIPKVTGSNPVPPMRNRPLSKKDEALPISASRDLRNFSCARESLKTNSQA